MKDFTIDKNHPDVKLLISKLPHLSDGGLMSAMDGRHGEGHYLRVTFRAWTDAREKEYKRIFDNVNKLTKEYEFEIWGTDDWEYDDDRTWDASITFGATKKK